MSAPAEVSRQAFRANLLTAAFLGAMFISLVGDEIAAIAIIVKLTSLGSAMAVALLLALQLVPGVFLAPLLGQLLDRRDAARVLALVSLVQAVVVAVMAFRPSTPVLLMGVGLLGLASALASPAALVLVPRIVGDAFPSRGNGLVELSRSSATIAGPILGGLLVSAAGVAPALVIDAASFAVAGAILLMVPRAERVESDGQPWWRGAGDGFTLLGQQVIIRRLFPIIAVTVAASSMVNVATPFIVQGPMDGGPVGLGARVDYRLMGSGCAYRSGHHDQKRVDLA